MNKRITSLLASLLFMSICSYAQDPPPITIHVEKTGTLSSLLGNKYKEIKELTITGDINATDIALIRKMEELAVLNLKNVNIKKGGKFSYVYQSLESDGSLVMKTKYIETRDNEMPEEMFERAYCKKITTIILPKSVTKIASNAFRNNKNVLSNLITVEIGEQTKLIGISAFNSCDNLTSVHIPNGMLDIQGGAFSQCKKLSSIIIPNTVTNLGDVTIGSWTSAGVFEGCGLTSIYIPESVLTIQEEVFGNCANLKEIRVSDENPNYISINGVLFSKDKSKLISYPNLSGKSFTIPESVTNIGRSAFYNCTNLAELNVRQKTPPKAENNTFYGTANNCVLYVPIGAYSSYWIAQGWQNFKNIVERVPTSNEVISPKNYKIYNSDGGFVVDSEESIRVSIYDMQGKLIVQTQVETGYNYIPLSIGLYIVNTEDYSQKIIVK